MRVLTQLPARACQASRHLGDGPLAMYMWWRRAGRVVDQQGGPPPGQRFLVFWRVVFNEILARPSLARTAMHRNKRAHHCLD